MRDTKALFFNGLGTGASNRFKYDFETLEAHRIHVEETRINWRSGEPFQELLQRMVELAEARLRFNGNLALIGASAGGSMAMNVFGQLENRRAVRVANICGRLRRGDLPWWDLRNLERSAHLGTRRASQSFYDSVLFCESTTLPSLNEEDKEQITVIKPLLDPVVPRQTMDVEGVGFEQMPIAGHNSGISTGLRYLTSLYY